MGGAGGDWSNTAEGVDMKLCDYIENLWQEGDTKAWAADAISGMMHFVPQLRGQLRGAGRLMKPWGKIRVA